MFGIIALALTQVSSGIPANWKPYTNGRYRYATCYPATFTPQRTSDNGDGRAFETRDARIAVWGTNNVDDRTLAQENNNNLDDNARVTYLMVRPKWSVQSGYVADRIFWRKTFQRGDQFVTIDFNYPANQRQKYDHVTKTLSACSVVMGS